MDLQLYRSMGGAENLGPVANKPTVSVDVKQRLKNREFSRTRVMRFSIFRNE